MINHLSQFQEHKLAKALHPKASLLDQLWLHPYRLLNNPAGTGFVASPWQIKALTQIIPRRENVLLNCCRGAGKTETVACAAYREACDGGKVLVVSPSDRQSIRFFSHVRRAHRAWGLVRGEADPTKHELYLDNGGHVEALPNSEDKIVGIHNVTLLVVDEAARVDMGLYGAVLPMMSPDGRIVMLSTPKGTQGFFHKEWTMQGRKGWQRHLITYDDCPHIPLSVVEEYRNSTSEAQTRQEYYCEFISLTNSPFDIDAMMSLERAEYPVVLS